MDDDLAVLSNKIYSSANKILMAESDGAGHTYFAYWTGTPKTTLVKVNDDSYAVVWKKELRASGGSVIGVF